MRMTLYTMRQSGSQAFGSSGLGFRGVGRSFRQAVLRFAIAKETCILFSFFSAASRFFLSSASVGGRFLQNQLPPALLCNTQGKCQPRAQQNKVLTFFVTPVPQQAVQRQQL